MTVIKQHDPGTDIWETVLVGAKGDKGDPGTVNGALNVMDFGAVGNGTTDDKPAIDAALAAAAVSGGTVVFPSGKVYMTTGGHVYTMANTTNSNPLTIQAYGASIKLMSGSGVTLISLRRDNMNSTIPPPRVHGGRWYDASGGTGNTCFLWRDQGAQIRDVTISGFAGGKAIMLQNWFGWSEQSRINDCVSTGCRHALYFSDGVDSGGPSGTNSFARTQVHNMAMAQGETGYGLIRTTGNVYHSSFVGLWGNLSNKVTHIIQDDSATGAFNGSRIFFSGYEGALAGSYFYYRPDGAWPTNLPDIYGFDGLGGTIALTNLTDPGGNLTTSVNGKLRVAGYSASLGTEWGIALPGDKTIISSRHPSGSNPTGTRVEWAALTTADELVIGSTSAGRAPAATSLGRMAPVKICAVTQPVGFFDATPVLRQSGITARAALEALGLGTALVAEGGGGASYTEYPPVTRSPGTIWFMPSNGHQAIWTGADWRPMNPATADVNACCVLGNSDFLIDAGAWSGTGTITNLGVAAGLTATPTSITQGTDGASRKYFLHDGVASDITLSTNAIFNVGVTDSCTLLIVKSQAAYVTNTAVFTNRAGVGAASAGWALLTSGTAGVHASNISDAAVIVQVLSAAIPANQIKLVLGIRDVGVDQVKIVAGSDAAVTATDTTTATITNANAPRIGRLAGGGAARTAMNHYVSAFRKRALTATEITTLQTWAAARFV